MSNMSISQVSGSLVQYSNEERQELELIEQIHDEDFNALALEDINNPENDKLYEYRKYLQNQPFKDMPELLNCHQK